VIKALESGKLVLTEKKEGYLLVPSKAEGGIKSEEAWSYGNQALLPRESLRVEIQVGLYEGKRVVLPVAVGKEQGQAGIDALVHLLDETISRGETLPGQRGVQACVGKKRCVKWCKDQKGKDYCCKYECVS
jgi:hypothetical protein